jgi:hypothetical protein
MGGSRRTPGAGFRRRLADEIKWWVQEGLIPPDSADRLAAHYRLASLDAEGSSRLVTAIVIRPSSRSSPGAMSTATDR